MREPDDLAARRRWRGATLLAVVQLVLLLAASASAQSLTPEEVRKKLMEAGYSEADIRRLLSLEKPATPESAAQKDNTRPAPAAAPPAPAPKPVEAAPSQAAPPGAASATGDEIHPFGSEIFGGPASTFEPLTYGPVDPAYPVGPGDELLLTLWGDNQLSLSLTVNREGYVLLPDAGQVMVNGLALDAVRARLHAALARFYSGLKAQEERSTTFLDVSLGRLRAMQVFLLGEVTRPGGYTVSSVARVLNALYAAGGPTPHGSMRDVRVMRGGHEVASVDLYDVILRGSTAEETRLQNGDVKCGERIAPVPPGGGGRPPAARRGHWPG